MCAHHNGPAGEKLWQVMQAAPDYLNTVHLRKDIIRQHPNWVNGYIIMRRLYTIVHETVRLYTAPQTYYLSQKFL